MKDTSCIGEDEGNVIDVLSTTSDSDCACKCCLACIPASLKLLASTLFQINVNKERDAKIGHSLNTLQHKPSTVPCYVPVISIRT